MTNDIFTSFLKAIMASASAIMCTVCSEKIDKLKGRHQIIDVASPCIYHQKGFWKKYFEFVMIVPKSCGQKPAHVKNIRLKTMQRSFRLVFEKFQVPNVHLHLWKISIQINTPMTPHSTSFKGMACRYINDSRYDTCFRLLISKSHAAKQDLTNVMSSIVKNEINYDIVNSSPKSMVGNVSSPEDLASSHGHGFILDKYYPEFSWIYTRGRHVYIWKNRDVKAIERSGFNILNESKLYSKHCAMFQFAKILIYDDADDSYS